MKPLETTPESRPAGADRPRSLAGGFFRHIPFAKVNWLNSSFLIGTFLLAVTVVPLYIWRFGLDWFQVGLFVAMFCAVGISITLGYHRLFAHRAFRAHWSVRLFTLIFGSAAFENSVLMWACDHRAHHRHVDQVEDPYNIREGFFQAHIGWLLFKLKPTLPWDNIGDLQKDPLVRWQHRHYGVIGGLVAFVLPAMLGYFHGGWPAALGGFLIGGVLRVVFLQHCTFCINSLCHYVGGQPYSLKCSARDSWVAAIVTFGEGYHNYHHAFPSDYRNGVKPWQFDPSKWVIWTLAKAGLAKDLRRIPDEKIRQAQHLTASERAGHASRSAAHSESGIAVGERSPESAVHPLHEEESSPAATTVRIPGVRLAPASGS